MKRRSQFLLLAALLLASGLPVRADDSYDAASRLAIRDGGRVKPLDTFARETLAALTGSEQVGEAHPVETVFSLWLGGEEAFRWPWVLVGNRQLREDLGLDVAREHYTFESLDRLKTLDETASAAARRKEEGKRLTAIEQEALATAFRMARMEELVRGTTMRIIPHPDDAAEAWYTPQELGSVYPERHQQAAEAFRDMLTGYLQQEPVLFSLSAKILGVELERLSPSVYPSPRAIDREVRYHRFRPFRKAWILYAVGWLGIVLNTRSKGQRLYLLAMAVLVAGWFCHGYGFHLRQSIAERPPVTNVYESFLFAAWTIMSLGLILEGLARTRFCALAAAPLAALTLIVADRLPTTGGGARFVPMPPPLESSSWLNVHGLSLTFGIAALALAMGLAHILIGLHAGRSQSGISVQGLGRTVYGLLLAGSLLLAVGMLTGALWASDVWGRLWGWEPTEVWTLIAVLGYLAAVYGRFAGRIESFGLAVAAILCFPVILMAWYGVNCVQGKGLHIYGLGSGGAGHVLAYALAEGAFVLWAFTRYKAMKPI